VISHSSRVAPLQDGFQLITGFPPAALVDLQQTIAQSDLIDSRII